MAGVNTIGSYLFYSNSPIKTNEFSFSPINSFISAARVDVLTTQSLIVCFVQSLR